MFGVIRVIIVAVIFAIIIFLFKKFNIFRTKNRVIVTILIAVCLLIPLSILPFENLFLSFSTPEGAYEYVTSGTKTVKAVINGDLSSFVVGNQNGTDNYLIVPKGNQGWQIAFGIDTKLIYQNFTKGIVLEVYQYRDTNDYYVIIYDANNNISDVYDNHGSKFIPVDNQFNSQQLTKYYAYVPNYDMQYEFFVE